VDFPQLFLKSGVLHIPKILESPFVLTEIAKTYLYLVALNVMPTHQVGLLAVLLRV